MIKRPLPFAAIAAVTLAIGYIALPQARAADTVGTTIYSPTPQMFQPFTMKMHMTPVAMKAIRADLRKMHRIVCTLTDTGFGSDMTKLECTPG